MSRTIAATLKCEGCGTPFKRKTPLHTHCKECGPRYEVFTDKLKALLEREQRRDLHYIKRNNFTCRLCGSKEAPQNFAVGKTSVCAKCVALRNVRYNHKRKRRRNADPKARIAHRMRNRFREMVKGKRTGVIRLLGCDLDHFQKHIQKQFKRGMAWNNYGKVWHYDHIIPIAAFDPTNEAHLRQCWHYTNFQPLFAKDNFAKGDKIIPGSTMELPLNYA